MTCVIPSDIEQRLAARAAQRQTTTEQLVVEALTWYLQQDQTARPEVPAAEGAVHIFRQLQQAAGVTVESAAPWKDAIKLTRR